jgi:hydroxymethylbilane synthase
MSNRPLFIASRGSRLALYQSNQVKEELERAFPDREFDIRIVKTKGDKILDVALSRIGDKGLFTKELEVMLQQNEADLAVHSMKDMPTELPEGLEIAGVLERADVRDALISRAGKSLGELDETDVVATSSLRRKAQLLHLNPRLNIVDIRGNVDTRLKKITEGYCTATVMAAAGLLRLGYGDRITQMLDPQTMLPAAAQGAIAIEIRKDDPILAPMIARINHQATWTAVLAERIFLHALEGGCQIPIGCWSEAEGSTYRITGFVSDLDGRVQLKDTLSGNLSDAAQLALELAGKFLNAGAREMIQKIRRGK